MKKLFTWLWFGVYVPANIRFGIIYGIASNFKFLAEIMIIIGGLYFVITGHAPTKVGLGITFGIIFVGGVVLGEILIRYDIPQRMAAMGNRYNPQINRIDAIAEKLGVKE